ncbi:SGNH/GDSL hydrolase family protein [Streptomyces cavourensis]|uniref:SGNH/GDSL hydrolase family protein n=1 Tax=Streptomyces cavourensis TaxID=67258 RepID=A0ABY5F6Q8_9ACTN|nr:SGNH/GDSL hydrolase family protein [Streptomyces cavourensis]UTR79342.1 SGNH/GDSL hydrolase family protein [Streptomyces cavourensis]
MTTRVACLGGSLTRAQLSVDYLDLLERRLSGDLRLARFGVNGDFAHNLLRRLDAVVADPPDVITVLIGTNDARASLPGHLVERTMKRKHLPERPSAGWFQECLGAVVERLRTETDATAGLLSLPVRGQELDGAAARASRTYSRLIAEVATAGGATCLPLHERQTEELRRADPAPVPYTAAPPLLSPKSSTPGCRSGARSRFRRPGPLLLSRSGLGHGGGACFQPCNRFQSSL